MKSYRRKRQAVQSLIVSLIDHRAAVQRSMPLCWAPYFDNVRGSDLSVSRDQFKNPCHKNSQLVSVLHCLWDAFLFPIQKTSLFSLHRGKPRPWKQTHNTGWGNVVNAETKCTCAHASSLGFIFSQSTRVCCCVRAHVPMWWLQWHQTTKHYSYQVSRPFLNVGPLSGLNHGIKEHFYELFTITVESTNI